ncbi:type VI secretion system-associated FHA domain protein TagH [Paraburkholderia sp. PGU19]|uniref:type VI secretion system-associated FHA domain protein TagH n=1 Tax=Paraburkholderia sp. PGU19 TaxID=2735434 RepID=UPI0015DB73B1|nr:type VI secretion system-associated FHA domain protein TagH [Paraburkholderia sp. PGU19]
MQLTVIEHAGQPVQRGVTAIFQPPGGTIGRNVDNHLVLPDETRQISRLQAMLQIDGNRCVLKNLSSVSVIEVNSAPLACAEERAIEPGDAIRIGSYMLRAADDQAPGSEAVPASRGPVAHQRQDTMPDDFWQSLESRYGNGATGRQSGGPAQRPARSAVSTGYDDLRQVPSDPLALFAPSIDGPQDAMLHASQSSLSDPAAPLPPAPSDRRDRRFDAPYATPDHAGGWAQTIRACAVPADAAKPQRVTGRVVDKVTPPENDAGKTADATHANPTAEALLAAFLRGAGLDTASDQWTTGQLHLAGRLLALFANGTVELLSSRSILKREVKADMTVLLDRENNPLKLLPDGCAVLRQMFGLPFPGFMSPEGAVSDAFDDLHAHQIAMVAGMRAALMELLKRFAPERLEQRTPVERLLDRYVPAWRKARLWSAYSKLHRDTLLAVEDDFSAVFGSAFLAAYDAEVAQYRKRCRG